MRTEAEIKDKIADIEHRIDVLENNVKHCASERNWDGAKYAAKIADELQEQVQALEWVLGKQGIYL